MIEQILALATDPAAEAELRSEVSRFVRSLQASAGRGNRRLVATAEAAVQANPDAAFTFDVSGTATLTTGQTSWRAGRFETPTIAELRQRAQARCHDAAPGVARLCVLDGASPATDIGSLQATAGPRALFQVASQFNCLESPGPCITPVAKYFLDPTQGLRASFSAFPATLLRHYAAPSPDGKRFVQRTDGPQIDLLRDVFGEKRSPVQNGYLMDSGEMSAADLASALSTGFDRIRLGVHDMAQVVLGHAWDEAVENSEQRHITQVFTSTAAGGGYGAEESLGPSFPAVCRQTLRAAYLGTLLAAAALDRTPAVLTLIGGGVFSNPIDEIWRAILWAFDEVRPLVSGPLDVVVNGHSLSRRMPVARILPDVRSRGGIVVRFDNADGVEVIR